MKKNNKQRIFLNSIIVFVNSIADKGIFVIISIVLARYFSVDDYGVYTTALWYATFFSSFTNIGINQSVIRSINLESQYDREHFANALLIKTVLAFIVYLSMVLSLFIISKTSSMYDGDTIYLILVFGIIRIGNEYLQVFKALYEAREKFFTSSLILTSFSLSFLMGTVVVIFVNGSYFHVAYIRLGIVIAFIALYALLTFRSFQPRFDPKTLRRFIEGAVPFGLSTIFNNTYQRLNGIILSLIHGTVYTGIFQNGFIFLSTLQFIPSEFRRVLLPFLYKNAIDKKAHMFQFAFE
ncbi:MAG: oligosaccharide flippase family protein, partial [Spirochaetota bacterium]